MWNESGQTHKLQKYLLRRSYCHRGMYYSQEILDYINENLLATWSPEQIACTQCELSVPSWRAIYRWIYEKYLVNGTLKVLRRKGKSHGKEETFPASVLPPTLKRNLALLNARPRKVLNFRSPADLWELELSLLYLV